MSTISIVTTAVDALGDINLIGNNVVKTSAFISITEGILAGTNLISYCIFPAIIIPISFIFYSYFTM